MPRPTPGPATLHPPPSVPQPRPPLQVGDVPPAHVLQLLHLELHPPSPRAAAADRWFMHPGAVAMDWAANRQHSWVGERERERRGRERIWTTSDASPLTGGTLIPHRRHLSLLSTAASPPQRSPETRAGSMTVAARPLPVRVSLRGGSNP
jgi:hypothetical protein